MTAATRIAALRKRVQEAVDAWVGRSDHRAFWTNWRGTGNGCDPHEPCVALVQYCQATNCLADQFFTEQLSRLTTLSADQHYGYAVHYVSIPKKEIEEYILQSRRLQLSDLVLGLTATVEAAIAWKAGRSPEARRRIVDAVQHYERARPLTSLTVPVGKAVVGEPNHGFRTDHFQPGAPHALLLMALSEREITITTWLLIERLLDVLFDEPLPLAEPVNEANLLLFAEGIGGYIGRLQVEVYPSSQRGLLVDPLAFGTTLFDQSLQDSLRLAFRCCRESLLTRTLGAAPVSALRLSPRLAWQATLLTGNSARGLFAAAMYATALPDPVPLDSHRTATVALKLAPGASREETDPLDVSDVELVHVGQVAAKLRKAGELTEKLDGIALSEKSHQQWLAHKHYSPAPQTVPVKTLAQLFEFLQGDARHETTLVRHGSEILAAWDRTAALKDSDIDDANDEHRLDCYVPPTYHIERRKRAGEKSLEGREYDEEPVPGNGDAALSHLLERLSRTGRLVVYDTAGAGKTVFSLRLRFVAAHPNSRSLYRGRAPLVVRLHGGWPSRPTIPGVPQKWCTLREVLAADEFLTGLVKDNTIRAAVIDYALKQQRVVLILDGFDQFAREERNHVAELLRLDHAHADTEAHDSCQWVITSRVHSIDEQRALFEHSRWTRVRINPLSDELQDQYFAGYGEEIRWREMIPESHGTNDLVALPLVLRMLRRVLDRHLKEHPDQPLPKFHTLAALFQRVASDLLKRAIVSTPADLLPPASDFDLKDLATLGVLEQVLSLLGFQMLLEENYNGIVRGAGPVATNPLAQFFERARLRYFHDLDEVDERQLKRSQRLLLDGQYPLRQSHWECSLKVLNAIELKHRATLEVCQLETRSDDVLAFRNRKMVECYAALYLTRYATDWDRLGNGVYGENEVPCAWSFIGDEQWQECWKLAIEMPRAGQHDAVWTKSLAVLFRPTTRTPQWVKKSADAEPTRIWQQRPTELMFRAWQVLKREASPALPGILADYRSEFLQILNGNDERAKLAAQLVPEFVLPSLVPDPQRRQRITPLATQSAYVRCPPQGDKLTFWMGSPSNSPIAVDDEKPRHRVAIGAFWMAACTVTREQYNLFDPHLEKNKRAEFDQISPDHDCPVIFTNWYDGFCLALWLGDDASLPTETEWEGAARAGHDATHEVIGIPPYDSTFTWDHLNYDGNAPLLEGQESACLGRTLPVRWDPLRREKAKLPKAPAAYVPNDFGVWQAHGNVWEWCLSVRDPTLYERRTASVTRVDVDDVVESAVDAGRALRGGSWLRRADYARSAYRRGRVPGLRRDRLGLRLVWRSDVLPYESSSS